MARIGMNPARGKKSTYQPARVTVAVLTYIPHLDGYFRDRFQILELSLTSLLSNTSLPYDLLIFDNGSCQLVTEYLQKLHNAGKINFLILSEDNVGKIGAFSIIFHSAPGEIVAYADDDIFYYPGWLRAHLEILDAFPDVGMVSGIPVRDAASRSRKSLIRWIESGDPELSRIEDYSLPAEWEKDWAESVGRNPELHFNEIKDQDEYFLSYDGVKAFGSASHFQFLAPKGVIIEALPGEWSGELMGEMNELDEAIDNLGYLRFSTIDRYTRHMGNSVSAELAKEASSLGLALNYEHQATVSKKHWLLKFPGSSRVFRAIYNYLFNVLHDIK